MMLRGTEGKYNIYIFIYLFSAAEPGTISIILYNMFEDNQPWVQKLP
jgi:hypothetical protein